MQISYPFPPPDFHFSPLQHDDSSSSSSVESSLTIASVTLSDSGIYKCTSDAASEAHVAVLVTSGERAAFFCIWRGSTFGAEIVKGEGEGDSFRLMTA